MTPPSLDPLVGLVVVSHSRPLAQAAVELAGQMVHGEGPRIAVAAGLDAGTLGTDAMAIKDAIEQVDGPAGVVVLMDLGSAVLSAELALDLAEDAGLRDRVTLSPAPLVEGLVAAVVSAAGGASAPDVAAEAVAGLAAKRAQLGQPPAGAPLGDSALADAAPTAPLDDSALPAGSSSAQIQVTTEHGLHARPVARLVGELRGLDARVTLTNLDTGAGPAAGTSPTQIALLGALRGHRLDVAAAGPDADEAVRRLVALAARDFDETPGGPPPAPPSGADADTRGQNGSRKAGGDDAHLRGVGASPGVVVGPVRHLRAPAPDPAGAPTSG
ncbi:MAG TPA: dihydroxyacetone kinase phosphoryl donor subunit DhaM, partial [Actinomycetales bacterium]|nr:dihydroxyacetone kinase phosphoryl donor subunit DhaM [Actinomycetales bacterium]